MAHLFWIFFIAAGYLLWDNLEYLFWISFALVAYTYFGYPLLISLLERLLYKPVFKKPGHTPPLTLLITAFNEEEHIAEKLENALSLNYPADKLDIVVASDGSTDRTVEIARKFEPRGVRVVAYPERRGKPSVLNKTIPECHGEIVVLADTRQEFSPNTLLELAANFADEKIGAVSGALHLHASDTSLGKGVDFYWRYEKYLRNKESSIHSATGGTGACLAIRRDLYRPIPPETILDDVVIPLNIIRTGYRAIFDSTAIIYDQPSDQWEREFARKARTLAGNYQILFNPMRMGNPMFTAIGFQFINHKFLRLIVPPLLAIMFLSCLDISFPITDDLDHNYSQTNSSSEKNELRQAKIQNGNHLEQTSSNAENFAQHNKRARMTFWLPQPLYFQILVLQIIFYLLAFLGLLRDRLRIPLGPFQFLLRIPYAFCLLHLAMISGELRLMAGRDNATWRKAGDLAGTTNLWKRWTTLFIDVAMFQAAIFLALVVRSGGFPAPDLFRTFYDFRMPFYSMLISFVVFYIMEHHELRARNLVPEMLLKIIYGVLMSVMLYAVLVYIKRDVLHHPPQVRFSFWTLPLMFVIGSALLCAWRIALRALYERFAPEEKRAPIAVVSVNPTSPELIARLEKSGDPLRQYLGFITPQPHPSALGTVEQLGDLIRQNHLAEVILISQELPYETILRVLAECDRELTRCLIVPGKYDIFSAHPLITMVNYMPMLVLGKPEIRGWQATFKRCTDWSVAMIGFLLSAPIILGIILARLVRGKRVFSSRRIVGENGILFTLLTFARDDEVIPPERFRLRDLMLQFLYIIIGEMSLVGPPPLTPEQFQKLEEWEKKFLMIQPGMVSLNESMSSGRFLFPESRAFAAIYYLRNYSLAKDWAIIARALWNKFTGPRLPENSSTVDNAPR